jgi:hypothetical protein
MDHRIRDEIQRIAVDAAKAHVPLDEAIVQLAPLLDRYPALEVVQAASEDYMMALRWIEDYRRSKVAV